MPNSIKNFSFFLLSLVPLTSKTSQLLERKRNPREQDERRREEKRALHLPCQVCVCVCVSHCEEDIFGEREREKQNSESCWATLPLLLLFPLFLPRTYAQLLLYTHTYISGRRRQRSKCVCVTRAGLFLLASSTIACLPAREKALIQYIHFSSSSSLDTSWQSVSQSVRGKDWILLWRAVCCPV